MDQIIECEMMVATCMSEHDVKLATFNICLPKEDCALLVKASQPRYTIKDSEREHWEKAYGAAQQSCDKRLKSVADKAAQEIGLTLTIDEWDYFWLFSYPT